MNPAEPCRPTIGVFASPDSWHSRELLRVLQGDFQFHFLDIRQLSAQLERGNSTISCGQFPQTGSDDLADTPRTIAESCEVTRLDGVVIRAMPGGSLEEIVLRLDILAELQRCGVAVINPARTVETCVDKYLSLALLQRAGLPVPATFAGASARAALAFLAGMGGRAVLKPVFGSEGRGLMLVDQVDLATRVFDWLESGGQTIYLQEFVEHGNSDLRVLVAGEELVAMRRSSRLDWRVNAARGATTAPHEPSAEEADLARAACAATGAVLAGVDLARDAAGKLVVLEINSAPGWRHLAGTVDVDVSAMVGRSISAAIERAKSAATR